MSFAILDGKKFRDLFIAGSARLDESRDYLDSINVFPVPDADTGSNMASTLNNAVEALHGLEDHSLPAVVEAIGRKLRMEARGNSGIILAEFFHGMFRRIKHEREIRPDDFVKAVASGKEAAYSALADPREGTMLTVIREAVASLEAAQDEIEDMKKALERMVESQRRALAKTPEYMELLRENDVVDSGAHGFLLFWEGALAYISGEMDHVILKPVSKVFNADRSGKIEYRFCTEALVRGGGFGKEQLGERLVSMGDSLIIIADDDLVKVHIHTNEPEAVFGLLGEAGTLVKTKVDDMKAQHLDKVKKDGRKVRVMVDSTADLDLHLREEWDIEMAPLQVIFGDESYRDRIDMTASEFYEKLKTSDVIPRTSLPNGSDYLKCFEHADPYCEKILAIYLSSRLSGTWQAGKKWGDDFNAGKVVSFDSGGASLALGLMALEAARMARDGEPLEKILARLEEIKSKIHVYFTVDTLKYLERNGRIGKAKRIIGQMLGMKPILKLHDGEIKSFSKAMGRAALMDKMIGILERDSKAESFEGVFGVAWSDNPETRDELIGKMREKLPVNSLTAGQVSPVIGAHAGPGAYGIICY